MNRRSRDPTCRSLDLAVSNLSAISAPFSVRGDAFLSVARNEKTKGYRRSFSDLRAGGTKKAGDVTAKTFEKGGYTNIQKASADNSYNADNARSLSLVAPCCPPGCLTFY